MTIGLVDLNSTERDLALNKDKMLRVLLRYFPSLKRSDLKISHQWDCKTVTIPRIIPSIGKIDGCFQAFAYAGNGLTYGPLAGKLIAQHFSGKPIPAIYKPREKQIGEKEIPW